MVKVYVVENRETHQRAVKSSLDGIIFKTAYFSDVENAEKFKLQYENEYGCRRKYVVVPLLMSPRRVYELFGNRYKIYD